MGLNNAIGMLHKLQSKMQTLIYTLKTAYHSLFEFHLQYGTQLWGQQTMKD